MKYNFPQNLTVSEQSVIQNRWLEVKKSGFFGKKCAKNIAYYKVKRTFLKKHLF